MEISDIEFEKLVDDVWNNLPDEFRNQIDNTDIVIEADPSPERLRKMKIKGLLLGLFEGVPKTAWGTTYANLMPNKITIFRNPILRVSRNMKDLKVTIHVVVMHEIAHYFGYNDNDMFIMDKRMRERLRKEIE